MKKNDYPSLFLGLLASSFPQSETEYKKIYAFLSEDFCPPFDRGALILLALDLYLLSFEKEKDPTLVKTLQSGIMSLNRVKSKDYGKESFAEYVKLCKRKENRQQSERYLCCLRSLLLVISSRI